MSDDLIAELLRHCKSEFGIDLSPSSGPRDLLAAELGLLKCLVRLGRAAMQRWCQQLGDGDRGSRATKDGVPYRRVGKRAKTIHGLFGWVTYVRVCYARVKLSYLAGARRGHGRNRGGPLLCGPHLRVKREVGRHVIGVSVARRTRCQAWSRGSSRSHW